MTDLLLHPVIVFGLLWFGLAGLGAFWLAAMIRPPAPSQRAALRALERIVNSSLTGPVERNGGSSRARGSRH